MRCTAALLLAMLAVWMGGTVVAFAAVRSYEKLSVEEQIALQQSERRVSHYDLELRALDRERLHREISADDYQWYTGELTYCIQQESLFQNAILKQRPIALDLELPVGATKVLRTVGKYTLEMSAAILEGILKGGGNFSP